MKLSLEDRVLTEATVSREFRSSNIDAVAYDPPTSTLYVKFHASGWYAYKNVRQEDHDNLIAAESVGKHFHAAIRSKYLGVRVEIKEIEEEGVEHEKAIH